MKKQKLELKKLTIAKLDNLNKIYGGSVVVTYTRGCGTANRTNTSNLCHTIKNTNGSSAACNG